jgi:hypothetical protein
MRNQSFRGHLALAPCPALTGRSQCGCDYVGSPGRAEGFPHADQIGIVWVRSGGKSERTAPCLHISIGARNVAKYGCNASHTGNLKQ